MTGYQSKKAAAQAIDKVNWADHEPDGLAQPEQEPVAWLTGCPSCGMDSCDCDDGTWNPPPQRPWVDLTNEEIDAIYLQHHNQYNECESLNWGYERDIEAKLKEKNT